MFVRGGGVIWFEQGRGTLPFGGFKTSDDAFQLAYPITFNCSIRQFLDLFYYGTSTPTLAKMFLS
jgi:hypothetical protein